MEKSNEWFEKIICVYRIPVGKIKKRAMKFICVILKYKAKSKIKVPGFKKNNNNKKHNTN